jgi:prepilin-type N-terminal cleavage/methylation domain-containing protein
MRRAFTLLEVIIALAILAVGLTVLVSSQGQAVLMTRETDNIRVATLLAQEKMDEAMLRVEAEGFTNQDIDEDGDFSDFGDEDFRGQQTSDLELGEALKDFHWAYTIRQIELELPDLNGALGTLGANDYFPNASEQSETPSLDESMVSSFLSPDMIATQLSPYLREVRVRVWWGDNEDETDQVELLTHAINPSGDVTDTTGNSGDSTTESQ